MREEDEENSNGKFIGVNSMTDFILHIKDNHGQIGTRVDADIEYSFY